MTLLALYSLILVVIIALLGKVGFMELLMVVLIGLIGWFICRLADERFGQLMLCAISLQALSMVVVKVGPLVAKVEQWLAGK